MKQRPFALLVVACLLAPVPGLASADGLAEAQRLAREVRARAPKIDADTLKGMVDRNEDFILLDVRTPSEIERMGRIAAPQQTEIPRGWLEMRIFQVAPGKDIPIVVYCGGGTQRLRHRDLEGDGLQRRAQSRRGLFRLETEGLSGAAVSDRGRGPVTGGSAAVQISRAGRRV